MLMSYTGSCFQKNPLLLSEATVHHTAQGEQANQYATSRICKVKDAPTRAAQRNSKVEKLAHCQIRKK